MTAEAIITAILAIYPHMSHNNRQCIEQRRVRIEAQLDEAFVRYTDIPREVLASVAFAETHLGCDAGEGGNWGAPISPRARHTAGTHMHAVQALHRGMGVCHTLDGAIQRFRVGFCTPRRQTSRREVWARAESYLARVNALATRIRARAVTPPGDDLTP